MNRLDTVRRSGIVAALVRGVSLREAARATGVSRMTVGKLVRDLGRVCARYQDACLRNLHCRRLELVAVRSFVHAAASGAGTGRPATRRDVWTWAALDVHTKLVPAWLVGARDSQAAGVLLSDLAHRLRHAVRLTTEWPKPCLEAVEGGRGVEFDPAVLTALYGPHSQPAADCAGPIPGSPPRRGSMPGCEGLADGPSKWPEMHAHAVALHVMHHNFVRVEPSRRVTPAMIAEVAERPWMVEDLVTLLETEEFTARADRPLARRRRSPNRPRR